MKICIIKLGADGDVLRTLPIAKALKDKHPDGEITWITRGDIKELIENLDYIDGIVDINNLDNKKFDVLYNFDIEKEALELASEIKAEKKYGFKMEGNYAGTFNLGAEYYLNTVYDDALKKENKKTYQEMMFMAAELPFKKEKYGIVLEDKDKKYALDFLRANGLEGKKIIGIHMGASSRWPSKVWHQDNVKEFIVKARARGWEILLFAGPNEAEKHAQFSKALERQEIKIYRNNPKNSKREFASLVNLCSVMVCSDSFSLHLSLGLGKKTIALFFVTSQDEVESYGLVDKIASPKLKEFFPERSNEYNEELVKSISADGVLEALEKNDFNNNNKL